MAVSRRGLLKGAAAMACSAAAHPLMTSVTFAAAPWDARLVVLILRGGMDGLDAVRPVGDPALASARPSMVRDGVPLNGFWQMHPALSGLEPLWRAEELAFAHAVSTPYRDGRSHFDGQDMLEAGTAPGMGAARDGWLNRLLQTVPGTEGRTAFAIGREELKVLAGPAEVANWSPATPFDLSPQARLLLGEIYAGDPLFAGAAAEAMELAGSIAAARETEDADPQMMEMMQAGGGAAERALAAFAAEQLRQETRIAAFSINGWDTHRDQAGPMRRALGRLAEAILTLKEGLGPVWAKTTVIAMTEFGRTVRENGTRGTDHGTGGAMVFAGGAVRGGRVMGTWPGLNEAELLDRRDLMPTGDVRAYAAWAMRDGFGLGANVLEASVFPGLRMGEDPGLLL